MRFKLHLNVRPKSRLPFNYQYPIMAWVYQLLAQADPSYATFLHDRGYHLEGGLKNFKLFTFSDLYFKPQAQQYRVIKGANYMELLGDTVFLDLSFYMDKAAENFMMSLFQNQKFSLGDRSFQTDFEVQQIEFLAPPIFTEPMSYITRSPMVISEKLESFEDYIAPTDERFCDFLSEHIASKYRIATGKVVSSSEIKVSRIDPSKLKQRLVHIKANTPEETHIKCYMGFSFSVTAPTAVQEVLYYGGFGKYCSNGMGCVDVV